MEIIASSLKLRANAPEGQKAISYQIKKDGLLIITIDAHNFSLFKYIFRLLPGDILHPHQYDISEYEKFLTDRSCEIIRRVKLKKEFFFDHYLLVARKLNN